MTDSKWVIHRLAQEAWKLKNKERYLKQKRECAAHPGYLAQRRATYKARSYVDKFGGEIKEIYASENETSNRPEYFGWSTAENTKRGHWVGSAWDGQNEESVGEFIGESDDEWVALLPSDESTATKGV